MTDLYLIAHKVRGEPAFDIASRMECPTCAGSGVHLDYDNVGNDCSECDTVGYWWIIPTSGHRAYPYWHWELRYMLDGCEDKVLDSVPPMPPTIPDHYTSRAAPSAISTGLAALLAKRKSLNIERRGR